MDAGPIDAIPDLTAPTVIAVAPDEAEVEVEPTAAITATFSEALAEESVNGASFIVIGSRGQPVPGTLALSGTNAVFTPQPAFSLRESYRVRLTQGITDRAGNPLAEDYEWAFSVREGTFGGIVRRAFRQGACAGHLARRERRGQCLCRVEHERQSQRVAPYGHCELERAHGIGRRGGERDLRARYRHRP